MPTLYDIDFNQQAVDLLPPDQRTPEVIVLLKSLLSPVQWSRDLVLGGFKSGATATPYVAGTYNLYDQVLFNKAVYECIVTSTAEDPTNTEAWRLIQSNFIGVDDRIKYNGQKIILEWALNKEFGGVFRQPVTGMNSDIYITNLAAVLSGFRVGDTEGGPVASSIGDTTATASIGGSYPFVRVNNFQINVKAAVLALTNNKAVYNFTRKYIPISLNFTVVSY